MAIAIDNSGHLGYVFTTASPRTVSFTVGSGADRALVVLIRCGGTDAVSCVTYAGVSMNEIGMHITSDLDLYLFYLENPASGANDIVVSYTGSLTTAVMAISFTGVKQTGQPEVFATDTDVAVTSTTGSITTIAANAWAVRGVASTVGMTVTVGTERIVDTDFDGYVLSADLKAAPGQVDHTLTGDSGDWWHLMVSLAPETTDPRADGKIVFRQA